MTTGNAVMHNSFSSPRSHSFGIYNPGSLSPDVLLDEFIARKHQLNQALDIVRHNEKEQAPQHLLVLGPRGIGKTTFLLALAYKIEREPELSSEWLPVIFPEETYGIGDLADFWLAAAMQLLQTLELEHLIDQVEELRDNNPEDLEEQARELFLKHVADSGKRVMLVLENLNDFFDSVSDDAEQHRLRAFLMEDDRLMIAASSPSYFDATGQMDQPFYDFFRPIRLEKFKSAEMIDILTHFAKLRGDDHVLKVIENQPERIKSLHVLTGGNPRLVKMIYRLLCEGGTGTAREDLDRLLEDCTPYFKHRIEELSKEERRVFDHVARHWDPVAVGDIQKALRRPSNRVSIYLRRLMDEGFIEEAEASTPKRKFYQVAERFYNIYYLMRFTRSGKKRLSWLITAMRALYSADDFESWTKKVLEEWKRSDDPAIRGDREAFLYSMTCAADGAGMQSKIMNQAIKASWDSDQLESLNRILDRQLATKTLGKRYELIDFLAKLPAEERDKIGYESENAKWWLKLAWHLVEKEQLLFAEDAFRIALTEDSNYANAWYGLGYSLSDLGRHAEAEESYRTAIKLDVNYANAWNGLGVAFQNLGRHAESEESYRTAIKLDANFAYPWNGLGNVLIDLGRHAEAEESYRTAIKLDANDAYPWNGLGNVLIDLGRHAEAEESYRTAIKLDANFAHPWNGLGNALRYLGRHTEAEESYRTAIKLDANFAYPWNGLGVALKNLGRHAEAEESYRTAIKLDANLTYAYAGLAATLSSQGRNEEAQEAAVTGVILGSDIEWARRQFIEHAASDSKAWLKVLPSILKSISTNKPDDKFFEFIIQGISFLISSGTMRSEEIVEAIELHGALEPLADIHFALRAMSKPEIFTKASPESKAFAKDFIARVFPD